jgi:hypothetical protein
VQLEALVAVLPCMREPTIVAPARRRRLRRQGRRATRRRCPTLIPRSRPRGGTDIVVSNLAQIVP